jgi:hypothetical protein
MKDDRLEHAETVRGVLASKLQHEFLNFVDDCRKRLELNDVQAVIIDTIKTTAQDLVRRIQERKADEKSA